MPSYAPSQRNYILLPTSDNIKRIDRVRPGPLRMDLAEAPRTDVLNGLKRASLALGVLGLAPRALVWLLGFR